MTEAKTKILIVEDEDMLLELLEMEFQDAGFDVKAANSIDLAIEYVDSFQPHIILSDLKLPVKSGKDLLNYVEENHPQIQFCFMSGYVEDDDEQVSGKHFFQKPFSLQSVVSQVKELVIEK